VTTVVRCLSTDHRPRRPQEGVVYQVVRELYETFRVEAAARCEGDPLPRFIDEEFRSCLRCGQGYSAFHQDFKERWRLQFAQVVSEASATVADASTISTEVVMRTIIAIGLLLLIPASASWADEPTFSPTPRAALPRRISTRAQRRILLGW
jgi:hypothetical protein